MAATTEQFDLTGSAGGPGLSNGVQHNVNGNTKPVNGNAPVIETTNGVNGQSTVPQVDSHTESKISKAPAANNDAYQSLPGQLDVQCGPLLRYVRTSGYEGNAPLWHGTVLLVTKVGGKTPELELEQIGGGNNKTTTGYKLYEDSRSVFWRFELDVALGPSETQWKYTIAGMSFRPERAAGTGASHTFFVPSQNESMRIMFHSCNGFSVGTDEDAWSGPALWNDVLRIHKEHPFHVMIGGGDQIYNDGIRVSGPLKEWTAIANPKKRYEYEYAPMSEEVDKWYFENYGKWYCSEPFSTANAQIPQVNVWDDHDIIDGFGSYTDHFMRSPVFLGIGAVAFKYYMLFQHHTPPPEDIDYKEHSTLDSSSGLPRNQSKVYPEKEEDSSWILGSAPGPYITQRSRSIYTRLGKRVAFLGLDARTERTRHQINYPETYSKIFERLESELSADHAIRHLIVLLGVPIAYPRLVWLENLLTSPIIGPIRFLNKRFGLAGGFFNKFDGQVDLLDDLDDHYTARQHKKERNDFMRSLQVLAKTSNVRITILGGDVHLAAIGRFYSNPKLHIPTEHDHRYMVNVISSAITNKPPPAAVANLLARRNKIHHLDHDTDETLLNCFDRDPVDTKKTGDANHCTMPSRNYAIITETGEHVSAQSNAEIDGGAAVALTEERIEGVSQPPHTDTNGIVPTKKTATGKSGHFPLHSGEVEAGTKHGAAKGAPAGLGSDSPFGLNVALRVEVDPKHRDGRTEAYGFSSENSIPASIVVVS
jgi:PhoD related phosphatase